MELERNTLEAMMRATDQKSTQQREESSASSTGQSFDTCWQDPWDAYWQPLESARATASQMLVKGWC